MAARSCLAAGTQSESATQFTEDATASAGKLRRLQGCGFVGYLLSQFAVVGSNSALVILLYCQIGIHERIASLVSSIPVIYLMGAGGAILLVMYMMDAFCPPHLPGKILQLWRGDRKIARSLFCMAVGLLGVGTLSGGFIVLHIIMNMVWVPIGIVMLRRLTEPAVHKRRRKLVNNARYEAGNLVDGVSSDDQNSSTFFGTAGSNTQSFFSRGTSYPEEVVSTFIAHLNAQPLTLDLDDKDDENFFSALVFACMGVCIAVVVVWQMQRYIDPWDNYGPAIVATYDLMFAAFAGLRILLDRRYRGRARSASQSQLKHSSWARSCTQEQLLSRARGDELEKIKAELEFQDKGIERHTADMEVLFGIIRAMICALVIIAGVTYVVLIFRFNETPLVLPVMDAILTLVVCFLIFVYAAFGRLIESMSVWLPELKLVSSIVKFSKTDFVRGAIVIFLSPIMPVAMLISFLNQLVRRCRGLAPRNHNGVIPLFTDRFMSLVETTRSWNWFEVLSMVYVLSLVILTFKLAPLLLNVLLAWMNEALQDAPFVAVLGAVYVVGLVLFMLPPVPGPAMYLFSGLICSQQCKWILWGLDGFWTGAIVSVLLCLFLKLTACAVQQKLIGELLGKRLTVRSSVGVHTPFIRAIELVLKRPGLSAGKVAILCGGPDWPTSVLCGVLRLPLLQILLGTLPIMLSLAPGSLTGSFSLRMGEDPMYRKLNTMMLILTVAASFAFWMGMSWAVQGEFDYRSDEISKPREADIDLLWLDFRAAKIAEECGVSWHEIPCYVQVAYIAGAFGLIMVAHVFLLKIGLLFTTLKPTDPFTSLRWFGSDGLFKPAGVAVLVIALVSWRGKVQAGRWKKRHTTVALQALNDWLDTLEPRWKAEHLQKTQSDPLVGLQLSVITCI